MTAADLTLVLPEILLACYAMGMLLVAVYTSKDGLASTLVWMTAGVMVALAAWIGTTGEGARSAFNGMLMIDGFARFAKVTILLAAAAVLVIIAQGKFHGVMAADTPMGCRIVMIRASGKWPGMVLP